MQEVRRYLRHHAKSPVTLVLTRQDCPPLNGEEVERGKRRKRGGGGGGREEEEEGEGRGRREKKEEKGKGGGE